MDLEDLIERIWIAPRPLTGPLALTDSPHSIQNLKLALQHTIELRPKTQPHSPGSQSERSISRQRKED